MDGLQVNRSGCHLGKYINNSYVKGKAKQTCPGSHPGPEGKSYWEEKSSPGRLPCHLGHRTTRTGTQMYAAR